MYSEGCPSRLPPPHGEVCISPDSSVYVRKDDNPRVSLLLGG